MHLLSDLLCCKSDDSITVLGSLNSGIFTPSLCKQIHLVCKIQLHTMAAKYCLSLLPTAEKEIASCNIGHTTTVIGTAPA